MLRDLQGQGFLVCPCGYMRQLDQDICSKCRTSKEAADLAEVLHNLMEVFEKRGTGEEPEDFFEMPKRHRAKLMRTASGVITWQMTKKRI